MSTPRGALVGPNATRRPQPDNTGDVDSCRCMLMRRSPVSATPSTERSSNRSVAGPPRCETVHGRRPRPSSHQHRVLPPSVLEVVSCAPFAARPADDPHHPPKAMRSRFSRSDHSAAMASTRPNSRASAQIDQCDASSGVPCAGQRYRYFAGKQHRHDLSPPPPLPCQKMVTAVRGAKLRTC